MTTDATLNQDGTLYGTTNTRSAKDLEGFTGGVFGVVADASGNILGRTNILQFGVNGLWIPGAASNRTDNWAIALGAAAGANGRTLGIVHIWDPKNRLFTDIQAFLNGVATIAQMIQVFCQREPILCAAVTAAL